MFSEVAGIARVAQRRGQFQQLLKTQVVILILNFTRIHCDYLLIIYREKLLNCWSRRTFSYFSKFVCKFLTFDHFLKTFSHHSVLSFVFHFRSCPLILRYIPRQLSRNETPLLLKNNFSIEEAVARQPEDQ